MIVEDALTCSTARTVEEPCRTYANAAAAAHRYVVLTEKLTSLGGMDPADPVIDVSLSISDQSALIDEKADLYEAFIEASHDRRVTRTKFRVWCHVRIGEGTYRGQEVTSKSNVRRWLDLVDYIVDCVLEERDMLTRSEG